MSAKEMFEELGYKVLGKYDDVITYYNVEYDRYIYFYLLAHIIEIGNEDKEFNYEELQAINKQVEELKWLEGVSNE